MFSSYLLFVLCLFHSSGVDVFIQTRSCEQDVRPSLKIRLKDGGGEAQQRQHEELHPGMSAAATICSAYVPDLFNCIPYREQCPLGSLWITSCLSLFSSSCDTSNGHTVPPSARTGSLSCTPQNTRRSRHSMSKHGQTWLTGYHVPQGHMIYASGLSNLDEGWHQNER